MKKCPNCGKEVNDNDTFCPNCGATLNVTEENHDFNKQNVENTTFCPNCGTKNNFNDKFCISCGTPLHEKFNGSEHSEKLNNEAKGIFNTVLDSTTSELNRWTGGKGSVKVSLRKFFGQVLHTHTEADAEDIFMVGTKTTTPPLTMISSNEVQPWLFSRILAFTFLAGFLLAILNKLNHGNDISASVVVIGIAVPFAALILFFEINVFKNISFYKVMKMVIIGGIFSLIVTIILDDTLDHFVYFKDGTILSGLSAGIIEETAKVAIAAYFINKFNSKSIFNGLLIGASVGTGFSMFENIQYLFTSNDISITYAIVRTLFSISDHTEWCAMTSTALILAKGSRQLKLNDFFKIQFIRFYLLAIIIHALWDTNVLFMGKFNIPVVILSSKDIILAIITWITIFVLIHAGLREVKLLQLGIIKTKQMNINKSEE